MATRIENIAPPGEDDQFQHVMIELRRFAMSKRIKCGEDIMQGQTEDAEYKELVYDLMVFAGIIEDE